MSTTLAPSFRSGNPRKTTWRGQTVHSVVGIPVVDGQRIRITRVSASLVRAQALKLSVDRGKLRANGVLADTIAVWSHSAPEVVTVDVAGRKARSIDVWNAWSSHGIDSSWLGHSCISLSGGGTEYTLRCSDGIGSVSFTDLVVLIELLPSA